jgi:hypothetical protein
MVSPDHYVVKTVKLKQLEIMPKQKTYNTLGIFLLEDYMGCKRSLILRLNETSGFISYVMYQGHGSSGVGHALSGLQCKSLPYEKISDDETIEEFKARVAIALQEDSVFKFIRERKTVKF